MLAVGCGGDEQPTARTADGAGDVFFPAFLDRYESGRMRESAAHHGTGALRPAASRCGRVPPATEGLECRIDRYPSQAVSADVVVVSAVHDCGGEVIVGLGLVFRRAGDGHWRVRETEDAQSLDERVAQAAESRSRR